MARRDQSGQLGLLAIRDVMAEMVPREGTDKQAPQVSPAILDQWSGWVNGAMEVFQNGMKWMTNHRICNKDVSNHWSNTNYR